MTYPFLSSLVLATALLGANGAAQADALERIEKTGVVRVAIMLDYPPFGTVGADMQPRGLDIDLSDHLAKDWGVKVEFVPVTAPARIPTLQSGKADVLLNVGRTEERAKVVDFTQPYAPYYIGIYGAADGTRYETLDALAGKSLAVTRGAIEDVLLSEQAKTADIRRYEDNAGTISAYMSGQADTMAIGNIVALSLQGQGASRTFEEKLIVLNSPVHTAVGKDETRLLEKMNAFLSQLKADGRLDALSRKWLKQPLAENIR
ncbi:transporter substrate-binding domain-containing protein [Verticiella sediminum]|nr:transporter substrate-binding domain-containing protein [Verticiella sediminum]